jgi:hypothetical protein
MALGLREVVNGGAPSTGEQVASHGQHLTPGKDLAVSLPKQIRRQRAVEA